ncbi:MAG TPA: N-acetylmuramoyl-L-alanine amidase, partial [Flavisolibacter sp.]|nr:N-acetylmuramoyl-L-alanine amidase [Flavisolibacter sp.]
AMLTLAFTVRTELTDTTTYVKAVKKMALQFSPVNINNKSKDSTSPKQDRMLLNNHPGQPLVRYTGEKKVRVIIDAGHGGHDNGAGSHEVLEKDIALAIAKEVQALNTNAHIEIIMTREGDHYVKLRDRADFVAKHQGDLLVSIHVGAAPPKQTENGLIQNPHRGFDVFIPRDTVSHFEQSKLLGTAVLQELNTIKVVPARMELLQRNVGIWILNQNPRPSIVVECGYLTNEKDRKFLLQRENQQQVAQKLLAGIESYLQAVDQKPLPVKSNIITHTAVIRDTVAPIVVKSGATFTVVQLQAIPFEKLLQPDTHYTMESALFAIDMPGGDINEVRIVGANMPLRVKKLIENAKSGNLITIDQRRAIDADGKSIKLPGLVYFIQ